MTTQHHIPEICMPTHAPHLKVAEAVSQNGRKIVVDADLALKLFNERRTKK